MKICLVKTSSMGDVIHSLPALTDLQQAYPHAKVDWVVEDAFTDIPRWHGVVNQVIPLALRRWRKRPFSVQTQNEWKTYRTLLQQTRYDAVIDAQGLLKSAFFAVRLAQGVKHGYDRRSIREPLAACFYDKKYTIPYSLHAVERIRRLFAQSLGYALPQSVGDYGIARHFTAPRPFTAPRSSDAPFIFFIHATTRADKFWLDTQWRNLAEKLTAQGYEIRLPWGNAAEKQRAARLAQGLKNVTVLPKLSLTALAAQLAQAAAVVSVDTGLAHLTAALDVPNVTLYGATDPKLIGTYGKNQYHLTAAAMPQISAEQVLAALQPMLPLR